MIDVSFARDSERVGRAVELAVRLHDGQRRDDGAPFVLHPLEVGALLDAHGAEEAVVCAGVLHDVLERGGATRELLERELGAQIARLVAVLSEDDGIADADERKAALRAQVATGPREAQLVFCADKVSKLGEVRAALARSPHERGGAHVERRIRHYRESLATLERTLGDHALLRMLRFQVESLPLIAP